MEKIKEEIVKRIVKRRENLEKHYLGVGYDMALSDLLNVLDEMISEDFKSKPSALDLIRDLDLIVDKNFKSINETDALKLFYYKLGWDRGESKLFFLDDVNTKLANQKQSKLINELL